MIKLSSICPFACLMWITCLLNSFRSCICFFVVYYSWKILPITQYPYHVTILNRFFMEFSRLVFIFPWLCLDFEVGICLWWVGEFFIFLTWDSFCTYRFQFKGQRFRRLFSWFFNPWLWHQFKDWATPFEWYRYFSWAIKQWPYAVLKYPPKKKCY